MSLMTAAMDIPTAAQLWLQRLADAGLDDEDPADDLDDRTRAGQLHHAAPTINSYRTALTVFSRWAVQQEKQCLGDLTIEDLVAYVRSLRRSSYNLSQRAAEAQAEGRHVRLAERSIHAYVRPVFGLLELADSHGALSFRAAAARPEVLRALPRRPDPVAPLPPDLRRLVRFYDKPNPGESERGRLIRLRNAAMLHLLFSSGARISEILNLNVGDVQRDGRILGRAIVFGKGRREGMIFIRRHAELALHHYLTERATTASADPLFVAFDQRSAGKRLTRISGWRIVAGAALTLADTLTLEGKVDEAELLRTTTPHTFRHFVGYYLLNEGVSLAEVSQILRHRTVEVTRSYYARYADTQLQEVHDQFSADPIQSQRT
jgi:integrase/recombinase XerD